MVSALLLICALVIVGKGLSEQQGDKNYNQEFQNISSVSLKNYAIKTNTIDTTNPKSNTTMSLRKMGGKLVENLTFRLPSAIQPTAYNLFLNPNLKAKSFSGNVKIDFAVSESVPYVVLHAKYLNVTTNKLIKKFSNGAEGIPIKNSFEYPKFEYFIVEPETELEAGNYTIELDFDGRLDNKIVGFYGSSYYDEIKKQTR